MKVAGIIAEYNPCHNGHAYHIEKTREVTGADYCIVVMSGDYVQRGTPAIIDKWSRTRMALLAGADLVLELPVPFASASAETFAQAGVTLLDRLGVVDSLCFGSEHADINTMYQLAHILVDEPEEYRLLLRGHMKQGNSYPRSTYNALIDYLMQISSKTNSAVQQIYELATHLSSPNNILGLEYIKAILRTGSQMRPYCIERKIAGYHSTDLFQELASATAIRTSIEGEAALAPIRFHVPDSVYTLLEEQFQKSFPITDDDFSHLLGYRLLSEASPEHYADFSAELMKRAYDTRYQSKNFSEWCAALKTKSYTRTRINRALLHLILNITKEDMISYKKGNNCFYARILGFKESAAPLLSQIKKTSGIPVINKLANANKQLCETGRHLLATELRASAIYRDVIYQKFGHRIPDDYTAGIIKV